MNKRVFRVALLAVLLSPVCLTASEIDVCKNNTVICKANKKTERKYPPYMKFQYNGEFFNNISATTKSGSDPFPFQGYNAYGATKTSPAIPTTEADLESYNPSYWPVFSGSIVLGCPLPSKSGTQRLKLETELLYSKIEVDNTDFTNKAAATYLVFAHTENLALNTPGSRESLVNNGFTNFAGMFNLHYDLGYEDVPIIPYISVGGGLTVMRFLGGVEGMFAYQVKAGLSHLVNSHLEIFAGYRYFGTFNNKFKHARPTNSNARVAVNSNVFYPGRIVLVNNTFDVHGLEVGFVLNF